MNMLRLRRSASLAAVFLLSGCATVHVHQEDGDNAISYSTGTLSATEEVALDDLWQFSSAALNDLGIAVTNQSKTEPAWVMTGRGTRDQKVTITLRAVAERLTNVQIRSGSASDYTTSMVILRKIRERAAAAQKTAK